MAFTKAAGVRSMKNIKKAEKAWLATPMHGRRESQARKAMELAVKTHQALGSADEIYDFDPVANAHRVVGTLPKDSAHKLAWDAQGIGKPTEFSRKERIAIRDAARQHGGLVVVPGHDDPEVSPQHMTGLVSRKVKARGKGRMVRPSKYAKEWGNDNW